MNLFNYIKLLRFYLCGIEQVVDSIRFKIGCLNCFDRCQDYFQSVNDFYFCLNDVEKNILVASRKVSKAITTIKSIFTGL
ncbi:uncharacterized protein TOL2_C00060 [Desulfobacula toluolica Tol2]|uniref:Uncharacterized protein n=1 Tax=Desulfobacula toluolica (strain DSM 7467 / Tol2) TaxID=651182 RepID=K0NBW2_DESTT|nr:uncharacterized protein TOL2_C00060 [Desulfobacula toluolica Tol2]